MKELQELLNRLFPDGAHLIMLDEEVELLVPEILVVESLNMGSYMIQFYPVGVLDRDLRIVISDDFKQLNNGIMLNPLTDNPIFLYNIDEKQKRQIDEWNKLYKRGVEL